MPRIARFAATSAIVVMMATPTAHAQRAVIIVDGERVELEFDEVDELREQLNMRFRPQPGARPNPQIDQTGHEGQLPSDAELRDVQVSSELRSAVALLDSDSYDDRERATALLRDASQGNIELYALLNNEPLSAEQRSRLLMILRDRLLHAPRGAVGISMRPQHGRDGAAQVEVIDIIEGLPAERVLKIGDRVTHIEGQRLESPDQLTLHVQSRRPGDQINLTVLRPRRDEHGVLIVRGGNDLLLDELQIPLTLGSLEMLERAGGNVRVRNAGVEQIRRRTIQAIMDRFGPQYATIEINAERMSLRDFPGDEKITLQYVAEQVQQHPAIKLIREHRRLLDENGMSPPHFILSEWRQIERQLISELQDSHLSHEHRYVLQAVLLRFRELAAK